MRTRAWISGLVVGVVAVAAGTACTSAPKISNPGSTALLKISSNHQGAFQNNSWMTYNDETCSNKPESIASFSWAGGSEKDVRFDSGKPIYLLATSTGAQGGYHTMSMVGCQSIVTFTPAPNATYAVRQVRHSCQIQVLNVGTGAPPPDIRRIPIAGACGLKSS